MHNPIMGVSRGIRTGAMMGTAGGARVASSFAPSLIASDDARTWLYVGIDTCLALGLLSLYLLRRQGMRAAGTFGFSLALGGLLVGRIGPIMTDRDLYPISAAAVAIGVLMLAFSEWHMRRMSAWIPLTFVLSLVVGGLGMFFAGAGALFILSGILFGGAFIGVAITVWLDSQVP